MLVDSNTEVETEWVLREYRSFDEKFKNFPSSIFEICFESKEYLTALQLMQSARLALENATKPFDRVALEQLALETVTKRVDDSESEVLEKARGKSPISAFFLRSKSKSKKKGSSQGSSPSQ
ncbi:hypothetical protein Tco_1279662 [Tanacetum coccineum]